MPFTRQEVLNRLRQTIKRGHPIIGAGAGSGITAKMEENGGCDLIIIYNSGRFRMAGHSSLAGLMPFGDANAIVVEIASEVLNVVKNTPVLAGVCGTDPFRAMNHFLKEIKELGFSGVQNFPTVAICDGLFRQGLEDNGLGFDLEVQMIKTARELDLFTSPYVFNADQARAMAEVNVDAIVVHLGITMREIEDAARIDALEESAVKIQEICDAAKRVRSEIICLCHGGPIADPRDVDYILSKTNCINGFFGASSMERLPTETAIREQVERFKQLELA